MSDGQSESKSGLVLSLLRHGETRLLAKGHILRGQLDDPLTDKGREQMTTAFDSYLPVHQWQAIISSPLSRCADIARQKSAEYQLPLCIMDALGEMDFGEWEGRATAELFEQFPDEMAKWWQTPTQFTPPDGESVDVFAERIDDALVQMAQFAKMHRYGRLCVITHGGVIKYLYCKVQGLSLDEILKQPAELGEFHTFILQNNRLLLP